jgi:hypothetical protein
MKWVLESVMTLKPNRKEPEPLGRIGRTAVPMISARGVSAVGKKEPGRKKSMSTHRWVRLSWLRTQGRICGGRLAAAARLVEMGLGMESERWRGVAGNE